MEFPDLLSEKDRLVQRFSTDSGIDIDDIKVVASPYRICPLGAHIDHQGGPVLGMTINAYTLLAYAPDDGGYVRLHSRNYPGQVAFHLDDIPAHTDNSWGMYPRGAALALKEAFPIKKGMTGLLTGHLPGGGLSSSASVLLAYLEALSDINGVRPAPWDYVKLTQRAENVYIGLNNGILDQTSIVFGKKGHLLHIDTMDRKVAFIREPWTDAPYRILVAYSGYARELTTTGYNSRVQECREAAAELSGFDGAQPAERLADVPESVFHRHGAALAPHLSRRANHFFSEANRVHQGVKAWRQGRIEAFSALMNASCRSSVENYECGSQAIQDLQQIVSRTEGVIGSRFSGGGFGGCVVGFVKKAAAAGAVARIKAAYLQGHPETAGQAGFYLAKPADGVAFL